MATPDPGSLEADIQQKVNGYISTWVAKARVLKHLVDAMKGSGSVEGIDKVVRQAQQNTGEKPNCLGALAFGVTQAEQAMGIAGDAGAATQDAAEVVPELVATGTQTGGAPNVAGEAAEAADTLPAGMEGAASIDILWLPVVAPAMETAASLAAILNCLGNRLVQETAASQGTSLEANQIEIQKLRAEMIKQKEAEAAMEAKLKDAQARLEASDEKLKNALSAAHADLKKEEQKINAQQNQLTAANMALQAEKDKSEARLRLARTEQLREELEEAKKQLKEESLRVRANVARTATLESEGGGDAPDVSEMNGEALEKYAVELEKKHATMVFNEWKAEKKPNIEKLIKLIPFKAELTKQQIREASEAAMTLSQKARKLAPQVQADLRRIKAWGNQQGGGQNFLKTWKTIDTGAKAVTAVSTRLQKLASTLHGNPTH